MKQAIAKQREAAQIKSFDRATTRIVNERILDLLEPLGEELGLKFQINGARFSTEGATFKLEVATLSESGEANTAERSDFQSMAVLYGLQPSDLDQEFELNGNRYRISGLRPKRRRFPIAACRIPDGKTFIFPARTVVFQLERGRV